MPVIIDSSQGSSFFRGRTIFEFREAFAEMSGGFFGEKKPTGRTILNANSYSLWREAKIDIPYEEFEWAYGVATHFRIILDVTPPNIPKIRAAYSKRPPQPDPFANGSR